MNCPICGAELDNEANECFLCGYKFSNNEQSNKSLISEENTSNIATESDDISKSKVPIIIIIVIVILLLAGLVVYYFMKGKENNTSTALSTTISTSSSVQTETTTEAITTTTSETTTITTTTTTTAQREVYAKDLIKIPKSKLLKKYFNNIYDTEMISVGQENVVAIKNTSRMPYYKIGFYYMMDDDIPDKELPYAIHVSPGGKINENVTVGMTYNELKDIFGFEAAQIDGGTFGATAWVYIDGVKWGFEFELSTEDKVKLGIADGVDFDKIGVPIFDLSKINPKSDLGYYIKSIQ